MIIAGGVGLTSIDHTACGSPKVVSAQERAEGISSIRPVALGGVSMPATPDFGGHSCIERSTHSSWSHLPTQKP